MSTPSSDPEQRLQEDLYRLEAYRNQLNALLQQHQMLQASRAEHDRARESLEGLERTDGTSELLIPLGAEAFLRGSPSTTAPVLIGVGSGVVVEMDRAKASELLAQRLGRLQEAAQELETQIRSLDERVQMISQRVEAMTQRGNAALPGPLDDVGGD